MRRPRAYRSANSFTGSQIEAGDNSLAYLQIKMLTYIDRLLKVDLNLDREVFDIIYWV